MIEFNTIDLLRVELQAAYNTGVSIRSMYCGDDDYAIERFDEWIETTVDPRATRLAYSLGRSAHFESRYGYDSLGEMITRVGIANIDDDELSGEARVALRLIAKR